MELESLEATIKEILAVATASIAFTTIMQGERMYHEAKKEYRQLDDEHKLKIQKPTRTENYITALKVIFHLYNPHKALNIMALSNSGQITEALYEQQKTTEQKKYDAELETKQ